MPETFLETVFAARVIERVLLTLVILVAAVLVMRGFWRTMSQVDFDVSKEKLGASANIALATPVFVLFGLIGFAWVSLSHPITVEAPNAAEGSGEKVAQAGSLSKAIGAARAPTPFQRSEALDHIRTLNCELAEAMPIRKPAIESAKLALIVSVWDSGWGDPGTYAAAYRNGAATGNAVVDTYMTDKNPC